MFKISTLNCWKLRIYQEILEEIYASNSVTELVSAFKGTHLSSYVIYMFRKKKQLVLMMS